MSWAIGDAKRFAYAKGKRMKVPHGKSNRDEEHNSKAESK
jgi:hypothetical protein